MIVGLGALGAGSDRQRAWAVEIELLELDRPDLGQLEPATQERLREARSRLDEALTSADESPADLGLAFGALGQLYYVYDLTDLSKVCFLNAQTLLPTDHRWPHYLGVIYILDGEQQVAEVSLRRALELEPGDHAALVRLGDVQYQMKNLAAATEIYEEVLAARPASAAASTVWVGSLPCRGTMPPPSRSSRRPSNCSHPPTRSIIRWGWRSGSRVISSAARSHLALNRGGRLRIEDPLMDELGSLLQSSQMYFDAGVDAMRRADYETALRSFSIARDLKPDDYLIPYNIALALLSLGQEDEAVGWLQTSVSLNPDFRDGQFNLAMMLANRGNLEAAADHFREAHRIDPEDAEAHLQWATALGLTGQEEQAIASSKPCWRFTPCMARPCRISGFS